MQRLLNPSEAAKISERLHDNALLQVCSKVWPERQEEITSVMVRAEDVFYEVAWLVDELIDVESDIDINSLISGLWSTVFNDIGYWASNVSKPDRYLIASTVFRVVATAFSLHWQSYYCDTLRNALLMVTDERCPAPEDLHAQQQQQRQQQELLEAIIQYSGILKDWINEYIDNPNDWIADEINMVLNPPLTIKRRKTESRKADKKLNSDYSRYSFRLNVNDKQLENLYVLFSKRDDKGKRFIDGDLQNYNEATKNLPLKQEEIKSYKQVDIDKMLFNQVFIGNETDVCIVWTGDAVELWYFINSLYNYRVNGKRLLEKSGSGPGIWQIVRQRFLNGKSRKMLDERTGKMVDTSEPIEFEEDAFVHYSKKNSLVDSSTLDAIIRKIAPPRDKNDKEVIEEDLNPEKYGIKSPTSAEQLEGDFHETNHH